MRSDALDPVSGSRNAPDVPGHLLAKYAHAAPRYTSYPPVQAWTGKVGPGEYRGALEIAARDPAEPISLYIHLPFCPLRCLYCGCNVIITRRRDALEAYIARLAMELDLVTEVLGRGRVVSQLHLGGGTPNYLDDAQLERLWDIIADRFTLAPDADTAVEADPRLASPSQLARLRTLGFRRISFGVQDLDPVVQRAIGRVQPLAAVSETMRAAREAGFESINFDIIYGLPEQTPERFRRSIDAVVELAPERVACFGYAHVPAARPHQRALARYPMPDAAERLTLNRIAIEGLTGAGYIWIGLDHFARPADPLAEAARAGRLHRNFNGYTTMPAAHLVAAGMSAIGEVAGCLVQNESDLARWHAAIERGELATVRGHRLTEDDRRRRAAIMSLMCDLAVPLRLVQEIDGAMERLKPFVTDGLLHWRGDRAVVTPVGRYFLRSIAATFDAYLVTTDAGRAMSRAV